MPVRQFTSRLTPRGWLILGGGAVAAILFIYLFVHMVSKPSYATIATGLEPAQTGKMTSTLDQQGIGYELQNNGTALAVQSNETARARVALAGAGLLGNNQPGFSLFEKSSLTESTLQQQVTYQRALQGQLAQTIDDIQGVSGAQVELVLPNPQSQVFGENQNAASAAVLLSGASAPDATSVRGIAQLVASSVPGLKLDKVTITDGTGTLLWPSQDGEGAASATGKQGAEERYDQETEANLDTMLAQTLGAGKAEVQVNATLNTNQTTQESLTYGKAGVPLQQSKNLETLAGNGSGGAATGTANIPAYAQTGAGSGKSNYKHEVSASTLGVDKTVTHSTIAPGAVESQHVSVLLDHTVPAASIPAIKEAVTNAAGVQPKRGDTISIGQMAFAKPVAAAASPAGGMLGYAKYALIAIASAIFLFFTTRALRRREHGTIDHDPAWLQQLQLPVRLSELERETPARPAETLPPAAAGAGASGGVRRQVEQLAESSPERVAQQLRSWMQED
jgi:flagellar M-ring protein FliF